MNVHHLSRHALETRLTALTALLKALQVLQAIGDYSQSTAYYDALKAIDATQYEILSRIRAKGERQRKALREVATDLQGAKDGTAQHESLRDAWQATRQEYDCTMSELRYIIEVYTNA